MKTIIISLFMAITAIAAHAQQKSFYDFTVKTIDGEDLSLSTFKGKDNFVIIGFPANNFLSQEPGSNEEIKEFCTLNYGVTFPMMAKISVKGKDIAPLYKWLTEKSENGVENAKVGWNFHKFLIDENGKWIASYGSTTDPLSEKITEWIEK